MALTLEQKDLYRDRFEHYRLGGSKDQTGNRSTYVKVRENVPCKLFTTTQYDTPSTPAGRANKDNLMTADALHEETGGPTMAGDVVRIYQFGSTEEQWYTVQGAPKNRPGTPEEPANYQKVFLATTPNPTVTPVIVGGIYTGLYTLTY